MGILALGLISLSLAPAIAEATPTWLDPQTLSAGGGDAEQPRIAISGRHETIAVWRRFDGNNWIVQASIRPPGGSFSAPDDLSSPGEDAGEPRVAVGGAGQTVVVWTRSDGANTVVEAATRAPDGVFSAPEAISEGGEDAGEPRVDVAPMGQAVAVWVRSNGSHDVVQAASLAAPGSAWSEPDDVSESTEDALEPEVALTGNAAAAVWVSRGADDVVEAANRDFKATSFSPPVALSAAGADGSEPQVGVSSHYGAIAIWQQDDGTGSTIQAASRPSEESYGEAAGISPTSGDATRPRLVVNDGASAAAWELDEGGQRVIQISRGSWPFGSFSDPVTVSDPASPASEPALALDESERIGLAWNGLVGGIQAVFATNGELGAPFSTPVPISTVSDPAAEPQLGTFDYSNDAVALWRQSLGGEEIVRLRAFDATAPGYGGVFVWSPGGRFAEFPFAARDLWSGVASSGIDFGDGTSASGGGLSHSYCAGTFTAVGTATDRVGNSASWSHRFEFEGSNDPQLGKVALQPKQGTGIIVVEVPCPGTLTLESAGLRAWSTVFAEAGRATVPLVAAGALRKLLMNSGQAGGSAEIVFHPRGASPIRSPLAFTLRQRGKMVYWQNCPAPKAVARGYMLTHLVRCGKARRIVAAALAQLSAGQGGRTAVRSAGYLCRFARRGDRPIECRRDGHRILSPAP